MDEKHIGFTFKPIVQGLMFYFLICQIQKLMLIFCFSMGELSAESKCTNDTNRDQPVLVPAVSSSNTNHIESTTTTSTPNVGKELKISSQLRKFSYNEIKSATRNFRTGSLIGKGGFGCVYKGFINKNRMSSKKPDIGLPVTMKTLNRNWIQGHKEWFKYELIFLTNICVTLQSIKEFFYPLFFISLLSFNFNVICYLQAEINYLRELVHLNLVKLIIYCIEDDQRLPVYKYMPRGSLENHLFRSMLLRLLFPLSLTHHLSSIGKSFRIELDVFRN